MIQTPGLLLTILAFALVIGPLVFIHELGHYLAGRWCGVKAEAFSIGFGREIAGWTDRRGTRWRLALLPLGGYVKFAGDMSAAGRSDPDWLLLPPEERAQTFQAKTVWQRAIIVAAGPAINFLLAILILTGFALAYGDAQTPAVVGQAIPGTAAAQAGLRPGDRIDALGGRHVDTFEDMVRYVKLRAGERVRIDYVRGGQADHVAAQIGTQEQRDRFGNVYKVGLLGIAPANPVVRPVGLLEAPAVAVRRTGEIVEMMAETIGQIVSGRRSVRELGGPLAIAKVSGEQITLGWDAFVFLFALVSINLGFINLLPVPMLDGGHLLFYLIEAVRQKPVGAQAQEWAYRGGLAAVLALMMLVTFNDLGNFGLWRHLAGLIG
ncbi:M50 family metallopeptidase [uncultured Sphingomonas sp.]|uniref:M50 family metallopeptidase n=1 Tax=uncultured Sphingomonas sp. TaxID=158754 RepID=UPI0025D0CF27|nr:M50 family metallopeptidase [uncultured Sphingomonas sp.]